MRKTFILPGMGADADMCPPTYFGHLHWVRFVNWPVYHIHGANDRVIFPPVRGALVIAGAGHLLPMTHAGLVARFIARHSFW